mmetsp:Transcript_24461/g.53429  ORF Transcript_24461/g.53429 Transcript_24461/m.53429 type:complete len:278 (-) Transcript_24461:178-1011(-)
MCQHRHHLLLVTLCQQRVVQHDALVAPEAVHVCVAVRAPLAAVHLEELLEGEVQRAGQGLDLGAQGALRQGLVLVEERCNECGVDGHEEEGEAQHEGPQVQGQEGGADLQDVCDARHHRGDQQCTQQHALEHVGEEEPQCLLVEAVALLHYKGAVQGPRQLKRQVHAHHEHDKQDGVHDLLLPAVHLAISTQQQPGPQCSRDVCQHLSGHPPQPGQAPQQEDGQVLSEAVEAVCKAKPPLVQGIGLSLLVQLIVKVLSEHWRRLGQLDGLELPNIQI